MGKNSLDSGIEYKKHDLVLSFPETGERGTECRRWLLMQLLETHARNPEEYGCLDIEAFVERGIMGIRLGSARFIEKGKEIESSIFIEMMRETLDFGVDIPDFTRIAQMPDDVDSIIAKLRADKKIWSLLGIKDMPFRKKDRDALIVARRTATSEANALTKRHHERKQFGDIQRWMNEKWDDVIHPHVHQLMQQKKARDAEANSLRSCDWITTNRSIDVYVRSMRTHLDFVRDKVNVILRAENEQSALIFQLRPGGKRTYINELDGIAVEYEPEFTLHPGDAHHQPPSWVHIHSGDPFALQITPREAEKCKVQWSMQNDAV